MPTDLIYKLQPHRTMHLQGFDAYGAAASFWGASDTGFSLSGIWRDQADFAVFVLWIADDPFGHKRFSYLPDTNFAGLKLDFDITFQGVQAFESKKYPSIDWPYLNVLTTSGTTIQTRLSSLATGLTGRTGATTTFNLSGSGNGRVTLVYKNVAFDYSATTSASQALFGSGHSTTIHTVTVGGNSYHVTEGTLTATQIANNMASQITAADPNCTAVNSANVVIVSLRAGVVGPITISSSDGAGPATLRGISAATFASAINTTDWTTANGPVVFTATSDSSGNIVITAEPGNDGNMCTWYAEASGGYTVTPDSAQLTGGSSDNVPWHITADFSAILGSTDVQKVQKIWLTFAAPLANGAAFTDTEFLVQVTNWTVTDTTGARALYVAGPGSVRIEEWDKWVSQTGYWEEAPNDGFAFWSGGRAIRSNYTPWETRFLTIETHCAATHDIYIGTYLHNDCGIVQFTLDGTTSVTLDCYSATGTTVRRKLFSGVSAGHHTVVITPTSAINPSSLGWRFYYDFLECAVKTVNVPDAPVVRTDLGAALDFDTDETYKLPPQRVIWNIEQLGLMGEVDHYLGVFWWNQRVRSSSGAFPTATITFAGPWTSGDTVFVNFGTSGIGKTVFPLDDSDSIAAHFCYFINGTLDGVWASFSGSVLTITTRSTGANWQYDLTTTVVPVGSTAGTATVSGNLNIGAIEGDWNIDPTQTPVLNRASRDWHADFFASLHAAGMTVVVAASLELVNPPDDPPTSVWIQRFPDGTPVTTATGFGVLSSAQCAFSTPVLNYMKAMYAEMAALMSAAGLPVRLQISECGWWFQANSSGMAFHDADTQAASIAALGYAVSFTAPSSDPALHSYADANFLRARLASYVSGLQSAVPVASWELLWPMDVNDPDAAPLLRYINLPVAWQTRSGSGFDTFVIEGYQYPGIDHSIDKARRCMEYAYAELSWDAAHCRYLNGLYYSGWPWQREYNAMQRTQLPLKKAWAIDHICLYSLDYPPPAARSAIEIF